VSDKLDTLSVAAASDLGWPSHSSARVIRFRDGQAISAADDVAEEVPVALVYNGQSHVVMLATPLDLEDFALGFSLTEGIVASVSEIGSIRVLNRREGIEVRVQIPDERAAGALGRERNLTGRTGCGLCGTASLRQAIRHPTPVGNTAAVSPEQLHAALEHLSDHQRLNGLTGAVHAAAWVLPDRGIQSLREDVGRHNALDKLIGSLMRMSVDRASGFVVVTSRASYEMVQKCAAAGIGMMAAISAPTGLAIRLAEETRVTLIGFARKGAYTLYATPERVAV
jgi:FdhD protein